MSKLSSHWIDGGLRAARVLAVLGAAAWFSGCAPLVVGGAAVGGALVATDRRTSGTQLEDQAIELKAGNRVGEVLGERGHVNLTSYNRTLLITGEVPSDADRQAVERAVAGVENLRSVVNELGVLGNSSLTSRSSDAIVTSKVKATFVDAKDLQSNAFKVVTERGTVYLMGRVTEREASRATELARNIGGVEKVVRVFEILSESELANLQTAK
jgi:osmotically-inducible protein OsmY